MKAHTFIQFSICLLIGFFLTAGHSLQAQHLDSIPLVKADSTGADMTLAAYHKSEAVVVVFTSNHCVYSKKYEDRLVHLAQSYQKVGIDFIFVNSNDPDLSQDERLELMEARHKEKHYPFHYVQDREGKLARAMGATKNPEVFVLHFHDGKWEQLYQGKIDDNPLMAERVEEHYLENVLKQVLNGKKVATEGPDAVGCNIKFKD